MLKILECKRKVAFDRMVIRDRKVRGRGKGIRRFILNELRCKIMIKVDGRRNIIWIMLVKLWWWLIGVLKIVSIEFREWEWIGKVVNGMI